MKVSNDTYGSAKVGLLKFSIHIVSHVPLPHLFRPIQNSLTNKNPYHAHLVMSLRVGSKPGKFAVFWVSWPDSDLRIIKKRFFFYRARLRSRSTVPRSSLVDWTRKTLSNEIIFLESCRADVKDKRLHLDESNTYKIYWSIQNIFLIYLSSADYFKVQFV